MSRCASESELARRNLDCEVKKYGERALVIRRNRNAWAKHSQRVRVVA